VIDKSVNNNSGFTLIELMIALSILLFLLMGTYTYFSFGSRSFDRSTDNAYINHNLRLAAELITKEIRFAFSAEILQDNSSVPESINNEDIYIFLNAQNRVEIKSKDGSTHIPTTNDDALALALNFNKSSVADNIIFTVGDAGSSLDIITEVKILNLTGTISGLNQGSALRISHSINENSSSTEPAFLSVVANPVEHEEGNTQIITVSITTANVVESENVVVQFLSSDGITVLEQVSATVVDNNALAAITLPDSLQSGNYIIKIDVDGISYPYYINYSIVQPITFTINVTNPSNAKAGVAYSGHTFSATGGEMPYVFTRLSGQLPEGITLNGNELQGTPTAAGTYMFTITCSDSSNPQLSNSHEFSMVVESPAGQIFVYEGPDFASSTNIVSLPVSLLQSNFNANNHLSGSSLYVPESAGNIETSTMNWIATGDIIIETSVVYSGSMASIIESTNGNLSVLNTSLKATNTGYNARLKLQAKEMIDLSGSEVSSASDNDQALIIESTHGGIDAIGEGTIIKTTNTRYNARLKLKAKEMINLSGSEVSSASDNDQALIIESTHGGIDAIGEGTIIKTTNTGYNARLKLQAKEMIDLSGSEVSSASDNDQALIIESTHGGIDAIGEGTIIKTTNTGYNARLKLKAKEMINLSGSEVSSASDNNETIIIESTHGIINASSIKLTAINNGWNNACKMLSDGDIDIRNAVIVANGKSEKPLELKSNKTNKTLMVQDGSITMQPNKKVTVTNLTIIGVLIGGNGIF
jgi:prepilin-type N-terminal cleavage/methylation domain-containing protein